MPTTLYICIHHSTRHNPADPVLMVMTRYCRYVQVYELDEPNDSIYEVQHAIAINHGKFVKHKIQSELPSYMLVSQQ